MMEFTPESDRCHSMCTLWLVALQAVAKGYALTLGIILHAESANSIQNRSFLAIPLIKINNSKDKFYIAIRGDCTHQGLSTRCPAKPLSVQSTVIWCDGPFIALHCKVLQHIDKFFGACKISL